MRELTEHKVNPANDQLQVLVVDEPGAGGAHHVYHVVFNPQGANGFLIPVPFQNGPIAEVGVNGLTHEVLLAILADRLRSFQAGPYACKANACALTHIEDAQLWLQQRTLERMRRGVEGTNVV